MRQNGICVLALIGAAGVVSTADAGLIGDAFHITAFSATGQRAEWAISSVDALWVNDQTSWNLSKPIDLRSADGTLVAHLERLEIGYVADPVITLSFLATSGPTPTHFVVSSSMLSFPTINAEARASAAITVTDNDGNGASFAGNLAGAKAYRAMLNGGFGGAQFAALVDPKAVGPFASDTSSGASPGGPGFTPVGPTSDMAAQFDFTVTANDTASGTSVFVTQIVPAPGAMVLGGLGLMCAARRRR